MSNDVMSIQLAISKMHLQSLIDQPYSDTVAAQALAELNTALAELEAMNNELIQQNEALAQITNSREAETQRYKELFERVPVAYVITDEWGVIAEPNRAVEELLNVPREMLKGKPISVFVPPAERREFRSRINTVRSTSLWEVVFQPRARDRITVQIDVTELPGIPGRARQLGWVIQNVSPQRAAASAEKMLNREVTMRLEAQASVTRIRTLYVALETMAHDQSLPVRERIGTMLDALVPRFAQMLVCYLPESDDPITAGDVSVVGNVLQTMILAPRGEQGRLLAKRTSTFATEDGAILQSAANAISLLLYSA